MEVFMGDTRCLEYSSYRVQGIDKPDDGESN